MAANEKLKYLLGYSFKVNIDVNYNFYQRNSRFFERAKEYIEDTDNDVASRASVAEKCLNACGIDIYNFSFESLIEQYLERLERCEEQELFNLDEL